MDLKMKKNLARIASSLIIAGSLMGCANRDFGTDDFKYVAKETLGAPASFVLGAGKDIQKDPFQGTYNLTGRVVSEAGRVVNGILYPVTNLKYEAEFGGEKMHPMTDNNAVKAAGWGLVFAPAAPWSYVEGLAGGFGLGAIADYFSSQKK